MANKVDPALAHAANEILRNISAIERREDFVLTAGKAGIRQIKAETHHDFLFWGVVPKEMDTFKTGIRMLRHLFAGSKEGGVFDSDSFEKIALRVGLGPIRRLALKIIISSQYLKKS